MTKLDAKLFYLIMQKTFLNGRSAPSRTRIWIYWGMNWSLEVIRKNFIVLFSSQFKRKLGVTMLNRRILAKGFTPVKVKMATGLAKKKENQE